MALQTSPFIHPNIGATYIFPLKWTPQITSTPLITFLPCGFLKDSTTIPNPDSPTTMTPSPQETPPPSTPTALLTTFPEDTGISALSNII